jgi:hypothetical protein
MFPSVSIKLCEDYDDEGTAELRDDENPLMELHGNNAGQVLSRRWLYSYCTTGCSTGHAIFKNGRFPRNGEDMHEPFLVNNANNFRCVVDCLCNIAST